MKKISLLLAFLGFIGLQVLFAQTREISGAVTSGEDGSSIPGASIVVKGTTLGTVTDMDGKFTLKVPTNAKALLVTFVGMVSTEVPLTGSAKYDIKLKSESISVDEVVVTALGITREKKSLGYSVQEVGADKIGNAQQSNVMNALAGRVAGVTIGSSTGTLGGSSRVTIRGANSVNGDNRPLYVVDGIPFDNRDFNSTDAARGAGGIDYGSMANDINPDNVETISVLKGAQASLLYGARGSNGVILITTKKGKSKKGLGVDVSTGITFEQVSLLPQYQTTYGGGYPFTEQVINGKTYNLPAYDLDESWGPKYEGQKYLAFNNLFDWEANGKKGDPETSLWLAPKHDVKDFFDIGVLYNTSVAVSGGDDKNTFRLSYTNEDNDGYMPKSNLKKNTVAFNGSSQVSAKLKAEASITFTRSDAVGRPVTGYDDNNVMQKFTQWGQRQLDMDILKNYKNPDGKQRVWNRTAWDNATPAFSDNPYWTRYENFNEDSRDRYYGSFGLNYEFAKGLGATLKVMRDGYSFRTNERTVIGSQAMSYFNDNVRVADETNYEFMVNYQKQIGSNLSVTAHAGANRMKNNYFRNSMATSGGLVLPNLFTVSNSKDPAVIDDFESHKEIQSVFANTSVGFKSMIYADLSLRNDWSSILPKENRSYLYYSAGLSFILTELPGLKENEILNFAKIRGSYAQIGNDNDPYKTRETYTNYAPNFAGVPRYSTPNTMPNNALKPEIISTWEIGGEFKFFNNRLGIDVTYYNKNTKDLITDVEISGASGYLYKTLNAGEMENKGIDLMISGTPIKTNDFSWDIFVSFNANKNKVLSLYKDVKNYRLTNGPFKATINAAVGQPYGAIMGTDFVYAADGEKVVDKTGRYLKTTAVKVLGTVLPDYNMGISNEFKYKNFSLSALIDIQKGGSYFSTSEMWGMYSGMLEGSVHQNGIDIREKGIILNAVYGKLNADGTVQLIDKTGANSTAAVKNSTSISAERFGGDYYSRADAQEVFDANYIKFRELTFSYTIPTRYTGFVKNVRVGIFGRNLAIWGLDNPSFDPESAVTSSGNIQGIEGAALPATKTYGFNLKFNL